MKQGSGPTRKQLSSKSGIGPQVLTGTSAPNPHGPNVNEIQPHRYTSPGNWFWPVQQAPWYIDSSRNIKGKCKLRIKERALPLDSAVLSSTFETQPRSKENTQVVTEPLLEQVESVEMEESLHQPERGCHLSPAARLQKGRITTDTLQRKARMPTPPNVC